MRYGKEHKQATRRRIIESAYRLFTAKGFEDVSIEGIMRACNLTRGGFYAHFRSKSELYREAIKLSAAIRFAAPRSVNNAAAEADWIDAMLNEYLDADVAGDADRRLAFLITDIGSDDPDVRTAYGIAFKTMSDKISGRMAGEFGCNEEATLSIAAMMIGAAAVARTIDDVEFKKRFLIACKQTARALIENRYSFAPPSFFWERTFSKNDRR